MYEDLIRELSCCPDAEYGCSRCKHHNTSLHCREDLMREAADAIEKSQEKVADKPKWISATERMPEDNHSVLAYCPYNKCIFTACYDNDTGEWVHFGGCMPGEVYYPVSHWMPLPEPPKEGGEIDGN